MYCSIQEAWPDYNNGYKIESNMVDNRNIIENFDKNEHQNINIKSIYKNNETRPELQLNKYSQNTNKNEHYLPHIEKQSRKNTLKCEDYFTHIENCEQCKNYILQNNSSYDKIYELFKSNPQLKETVVVFLIGIAILMIINLFYRE